MIELFNFDNYIFNWYTIFPSFTGVIIFITGFFIFIKNRKSVLAWSYLVFVLFLGLWLLGFGILYSIKDPELALFWNNNFAFLGVIAIPANFFFFSSAYVGLNYRRILLTIFGYIFVVFFYILTVKQILMPEVKLFYWGWYPQFNKVLSIPFLTFFYLYMVGGFYNLLWVWRRKAVSVDHGSMKLLFLAFFVAYLASIDYLPSYGFPVYPIGYLFLLIFNFTLAYLVTRRKLLVITPAIAAEKIINTMAESLIVTNQDFKIEFVNDATLELFACNKDELVGMSYEKTLKNKKILENKSFYKNINNKSFINVDIDYVTKINKQIPCKVSISQLVDHEKDPIGFVIVSRDVSEIKKYIKELQTFKTSLEEKVRSRTSELEEAHDKVAAIISNLVDPIIVTDSEGRLSLVNDAAVRILGIKQKSIGKSIVDKNGKFLTNELKKITTVNFTVKARESTENSKAVVEDFVLKGEKQIFHRSNPFLAGKSHYEDKNYAFKVITVSVKSKDRQYYGDMKIFYNLTREKLLDKMKTEFISIAAHQLRTPLSAIKWSIQMVLDGDAGKTTKEQINILQKGYSSNERAIKLVNQMLNVARIEEGKFSYQLEKCNFKELLNFVLDEAKDELRLKKIKIKKEITSSSLTLKIDKEKITLALQNLLDNAIKYTAVNGKIYLSVKARENFLIIIIKDNGIGIVKEDQLKIFSKFFRGENAVRVLTDGSGLGLYITKNIIEEHNGEIKFMSQEGVGTEFIIKLPIN